MCILEPIRYEGMSQWNVKVCAGRMCGRVNHGDYKMRMSSENG